MSKLINFTKIFSNYTERNSNIFRDYLQSSTEEDVKTAIDLLYSYFNISVTDLGFDLDLDLLGIYTGKATCGDFVDEINIGLNNEINISFKNSLILKDKLISSPLINPAIQSVVTEINQSLPLLDSLRLSNDGINYLPVFPYIKPYLSFSYMPDIHEIKLYIDFKIVVKSSMIEILSPYLLYANNESIQEYGQSIYRDIKNIYSISGEVIRDDFKKYRSLMLKAFDLPENSFDVDYVRLGLVNDMTNI